MEASDVVLRVREERFSKHNKYSEQEDLLSDK